MSEYLDTVNQSDSLICAKYIITNGEIMTMNVLSNWKGHEQLVCIS